MKVLLRVRQQPSSISQSSSSTPATNATTPSSPTTAPLSSSGTRPASSAVSVSAGTGTSKTSVQLNAKEDSDTCQSLNLREKSIAPDVSSSSSSGGIIRAIADSKSVNPPVKALQPVVQPALPPLSKSSLPSVEDSAPVTNSSDQNSNSSTRGVETTRKNKSSSVASAISASRIDPTPLNSPINCQSISQPLSAGENHETASNSFNCTTTSKPCTERNHIAAIVTTDRINNSKTSKDRFTEPKQSSHKEDSTLDSFELSLRKGALKDINASSTSTSLETATTGESNQNSVIEHKRKANRNLETDSGLSSQLCSSSIATTTTSALTSSHTSSSQQHRKVEIKSNNGNKRRKMGRYYNSDRIGEAANGIDETDTTTSSSSSSSSPSTRHLVRVHNNNMEGIATRGTRTMTDHQNENPAYDIERARVNQNSHNFASVSSDNVGPLRSNIENYKLPGSNATNNVVIAEEELDEVKNVDEEEVAFQIALKKRGLEMVEQEGDGNCLFRAVSLQIYGDSEVHMDVRRRCLDFMAKDEAHFSEFVVDEPFMQYILRKRQNGVHGNNPEIQAISELYNRPVEVFVPSNGATPINIFQAAYKTCDAPLRLSYHDGNHYNAVTDPLCPTAGLGLGLPGLEPGLADRMQMQQAVDESEDLHVDKLARESHEMEIQKAIVESKRDSGKGFDMYYKQKAALMETDMEATDFELEQAALANSLQSHFNNEGGQKQPWNHSGQHMQQQQRSRDRWRYQSGQSTSTSSTWVSETPSTSTSMRLRAHSSSPSPLVASMPSVASVATSSQEGTDIPAHLLNNSHGEDDEYPQTVQELVMNGFPLERVVKAYDLIGDNFDNLLAFLMSSS